MAAAKQHFIKMILLSVMITVIASIYLVIKAMEWSQLTSGQKSIFWVYAFVAAGGIVNALLAWVRLKKAKRNEA